MQFECMDGTTWAARQRALELACSNLIAVYMSKENACASIHWRLMTHNISARASPGLHATADDAAMCHGIHENLQCLCNSPAREVMLAHASLDAIATPIIV